MVRFLFLSLALFCGIAIAANRGLLTSSPSEADSESGNGEDGFNQARVSDKLPLNAKRARAALVGLIESPHAGEMTGTKLKELAPEEENRIGYFHMGPFLLDLDDARYTYRSTEGGIMWKCDWTIEGRFHLKNGKWTASPPHAKKVACSK